MGDIQTYADLWILFARCGAFALGVGFVTGLCILVPFFIDEWHDAGFRPRLRRQIKFDIIKTAFWLLMMLTGCFFLIRASF